MNSEIQKLLDENAANQQKAESLTAALTDDEFNRQPAPGKWSIGQHIAHLNVIYDQDLDTIAKSVAAAKSKGLTGSGPFRYGFLSSWFVKSMEPPPKRKFKAPKFYEPLRVLDSVNQTLHYRQNTNRLADLIRSADGLDLTRAKTPMVMPKWATIPLGARLNLLVTHDRRHLWHIEQILRKKD